jgi:2-succinyl-5-enolpyruvyl-6-hydroxy-3-cyclohexene-1-carboxylate synthase
LIAALKNHGINNIIASPGTTNSSFVASVQHDAYFNVVSCVDERSAAYMACGLAGETNKPVVITCTGATASRNYLPGLTEAYYRKLPILAVTGTQVLSKVSHLTAQVIDRSVQPKDCYRCSVTLPVVKDKQDQISVELNSNIAILELNRNGGGPVHIDLETAYNRSFGTKALPSVRKISRFDLSAPLPPIESNKTAVFIGAHRTFSEEETAALEHFCEANNAVVFHDHTSGYYGKYGVNMSLVASQKYLLKDSYRPELLIHIGEVSGDYPTFGIGGNEVWRVSPDGEIRDTFGKLRHVFEMKEKDFFLHYSQSGIQETSYYQLCVSLDQQVRAKLPDLPFSNIWLASRLAHKIPANSVIHFGILNSLRSWNLFPLPVGVRSSSNVGGFGIDGGMSALIGASLANPDKLYYLVIGDLAFFYDMNSLGNRHLGKNLRILLVNNGRGTEFRQYNHHTSHFGDDADAYIAAAGHFGNKSPDLVKHYASSLGLKYISASNASEFSERIPDFTSTTNTNESIIFEVFTDSKMESEALEITMNLQTDNLLRTKDNAKQLAIKFIGKQNIQSAKKLMGKKRTLGSSHKPLDTITAEFRKTTLFR